MSQPPNPLGAQRSRTIFFNIILFILTNDKLNTSKKWQKKEKLQNKNETKNPGSSLAGHNKTAALQECKKKKEKMRDVITECDITFITKRQI